MNLQIVWEYFGSFNDSEFSRILVLLMFVIGIPLVVGVTANLWVWAIQRVRTACRLLQEQST